MITFIAVYLFLKAVILLHIDNAPIAGVLLVLLLATILAVRWLGL